MLILILLSLILSILVIVVFSSNLKSILSISLYLITIIYTILFAMYFAKTGGLTISENSRLLGPVWLVTYIQAYPISADRMASIMVLLRVAFCAAFFFNSIVSNYIVKVLFISRKWLYAIVLMPLLAILIIMQPAVFSYLFAYKYSLQHLVVNISDCLLLLSLIMSFGFFLIEYRDVGIPVMRARHRNLMLSSLLLSIVFLFFSSLNPATVFQDYTAIRVYSSSIIPIYGYNVYPKWIFILSSCLILLVTVLIQNIKYYRFTYNRSQNELLINRRQRALGNSSSVFVHGLKNQVIVAEILILQLMEEVKSTDNPGSSELIMLQQLSDQIDIIHKRLDMIYKAFMKVELKLVRTSLNDLFMLIKAKLPNMDDAGIRYEISDCAIIADKELLGEAIYNIIDNAIEATAGMIAPSVIVIAKPLRARVMIIIRNNGPEIPKEVKESIFQPFMTTKNTGHNWGLGLYYSHMIIKMHFGDIQVESNNGGYTEFMISLPKTRVRQ